MRTLYLEPILVVPPQLSQPHVSKRTFEGQLSFRPVCRSLASAGGSDICASNPIPNVSKALNTPNDMRFVWFPTVLLGHTRSWLYSGYGGIHPPGTEAAASLDPPVSKGRQRLNPGTSELESLNLETLNLEAVAPHLKRWCAAGLCLKPETPTTRNPRLGP